jgi:hypothetical protein
VALNNTKSGLKNLLSSLLSSSNSDQNMFLPPSVYSSMVNTITSFLIDRCVEVYPTSSKVIEIIDPFVKVAAITPSNGIIKLPPDFRNILGSPSIIVSDDKKGECGDSGIPITNAQQFLAATVKGGCTRRPITIVAQSEFDYLTTSSYKKPSFWNPICFNKGENELKVCPTDVTKVYVMYVKQEKIYNFGYIPQPDDTYYIDEATTIDTEWNNAGFTPLFKGLTHLYGIYSRDKEFSNWANVLSQISIV